jgi:hypothetical protein
MPLRLVPLMATVTAPTNSRVTVRTGAGNVTVSALTGRLVFAADVTVASASTITLAAVSQLEFLGNFDGTRELDLDGTGTVTVHAQSPLLVAEHGIKLKVGELVSRR